MCYYNINDTVCHDNIRNKKQTFFTKLKKNQTDFYKIVPKHKKKHQNGSSIRMLHAIFTNWEKN